MRDRVITFLRSRGVSGMITAVLVKVLTVVLNFLLITLAARTLSEDAFGHYSILYSAASLLYIVAAVGQEPFSLRIWNELTSAGNAAQLKGALIFSLVACLCASAAVGMMFWPWALTYVDHAAAAAALCYLLVSAPLQIAIHIVRTELGAVRGDGVSFAIIGIPPVVYLGSCLLTGEQATIAGIFLALACGGFVALVLQVGLIFWRVNLILPDFSRVKVAFNFRRWLPQSGKLWLTTTLEATNQYIDVIIIGFLMDPATAGAYFVTVRLSNLFAAAADAINLFATHHLPGLYYRGEKLALERTLDSLAWITLAFLGLGLVGILIGGYWVLWIINHAYTGYFPELLILCVGTAIAATARASILTLVLSGHEGRYLQITAVCVVLRVICLFALVPHFAVTGAVVASAVSFTIQALALRWADKSLTGLDASVLRLLKRRPVAA